MTFKSLITLLALSLLLIACRRTLPAELWIIPKGYVGWLRLDYGGPDTPELPLEGGHRVVQMPIRGRLRTSTATAGSVDHLDFTLSGHNDRLPSFLPKLVEPSFGIQIAYTVSSAPIGSGEINLHYACVFVGTPADFTSNKRNCDEWRFGDLLPPESDKHAKPKPKIDQ